MAKFLMLGRYSAKAIEGISAERTKKAVGLIEKAGGKVNMMLALLGSYDLALIVELPAAKDAVKVSVELAKMTGIGFNTLAAMPVEEFDRTVGK